MGNTAEVAKVEIPPVGLRVEPDLVDPCGEFVQIVFSLAAADDLTEARNQKVHRPDGASLLVLLHVKRFDLSRIVGNKEWASHHLLGEILLMLALQIRAPEGRILEGSLSFLQRLDRLGVAHPGEVRLHNLVETLEEAVEYPLVKEGHILRRLLEDGSENELDEALGKLHVALQITEGNLRLDHPELREMSGGVAVLRPEGGTKGVDPFQGGRVDLRVELTTDGEIGGATEKLLPPVTVGSLGHGGDPKEFSRPLGIACGDDRGVDVDEPALLEKPVDPVAQTVSHPGYGTEGVGSRSQVGYLTEILEAVPLFLHRVIRGSRTDELETGAGELDSLILPGRVDELSLNGDARPRGDRVEVVLDILFTLIDYDLEIGETGAVVKFEKADVLAVPFGPDPSMGSNRGARRNRAK